MIELLTKKKKSEKIFLVNNNIFSYSQFSFQQSFINSKKTMIIQDISLFELKYFGF